MANRGSPADYNEWESRGASGWRWDTVLPYFRKVERDIDFDGPLHGSDGRIPVRRVFPDNWSDYARATADAFKMAGYRYVPDQNGEFQDGYYPLAMSNLYDRRVSAAVGYLGATVRQRDNLTILTDTQVSELLFEDTQCVGIRALVRQQQMEFRAAEVILCCGVNSLARGVVARRHRTGWSPALNSASPCARTVQASGRRLMDHLDFGCLRCSKPGARNNYYSKRSLHLGMRFSSGIDGAPQGDMALTASNKSAWHAIGDRIAVITLWVNKTFSETGQVRLSGTDWRQEPDVDQPVVRITAIWCA